MIEAVCHAVGDEFPVGIKLSATEQLVVGFAEDESLELVAQIDRTSIDLIDISGGTYLPGVASSSDRWGSGPYFLDIAERARAITVIPLMVTGGFKTRARSGIHG